MGAPTIEALTGQRPHWLLRSGVWSAYLLALVVVTVVFGLPTDRIYQAVWIVVGIAAFSPDRPWRDHVRTLIDWIPLIAALVVYDHTRGIANTLGMPVRVEELVTAESWLFGGTIPTVWLQDHLIHDGAQPWWTLFTGMVYTSHFVLPWLIAAIFYVQSRDRWSKYMRRIVLLSYLGLLTYVLLPAAPPWYAAREGVLGAEVYRGTGFGFHLLSVDVSGDWLAAQGNPVAALPSLHSAFALLVTVALWPSARNWWWKIPLALFPLAMAFTLVYGGEHYVVDVLAGWAYVGLTILLARAWERRRKPAGPLAQPEPDGRHAP
ncbi:inositol phosphorylceramide synthase [Nocardia speluncae]|uniref:Inositol phosphorylceramide synthase n=1 Tax=Nocardia speluncae TaxID=419477 RepID=A0A846XEQ8_9NOCA|nr:inositol phosphorylceramide synthase [Nocardia speluncae]